MRRREERTVLLAAFRAGGDRFGLRLVHYSIQSNHVHAIVEVRDNDALTRGMQGLAVRIAKALNRLWSRRGRVFADRFHSRALQTPRETRYALAYVLNNARKHAVRVEGLDPCSSAAAFDGWLELRTALDARVPVCAARSWLLTIGWRKHGRIRVTEVPSARPVRGHR